MELREQPPSRATGVPILSRSVLSLLTSSQQHIVRLTKGMSRSDKVRVLERVIESLGLQEIRNSLVGIVDKRGISGGQRKRVNVGIEMVMERSLLILDKPTTVLDRASSQLLLRALRHEALEAVNVCVVIHQPSTVMPACVIAVIFT